MSSEVVTYRRIDSTAEVVIDYPPVNVLGAAVRHGLMSALETALADESVQVILLASAGKIFSAGADLSEFDAPVAEPSLQSVMTFIESATKPVVVALHGSALGGGLELALACHYRVAAADAKLALPEVTLGLIPGAGGTQRLPRIVGALAALDMIVSGARMDATTAQRIGLVDAVVADDFRSGTRHYCEQLIQQGAKPRPTREQLVDITGFDSAGIGGIIDKYLHALKGRTTQQLIIEAITAATKTALDEGLAIERRLADQSLEAMESKALRHMFFAERQAKGLSSDTSKLIGNKMMPDGYWHEAKLLMREGASPEQIDTAMESFGFARGPTHVNDPVDTDTSTKMRDIELPEIIERCLLRLINVGALMLETGDATRASDIDVVWVRDYGFPRHKGGPMFYADSQGLPEILGRIEHYRQRLGDGRWKPAALIEQLAHERSSFARWDRERR